MSLETAPCGMACYTTWRFGRVLLALIPGMARLWLLPLSPAGKCSGFLNSRFLWTLRSVWVTNGGAFCTVGRTGVKSTVSEVPSALGVSLPIPAHNLLRNLT